MSSLKLATCELTGALMTCTGSGHHRADCDLPEVLLTPYGPGAKRGRADGREDETGPDVDRGGSDPVLVGGSFPVLGPNYLPASRKALRISALVKTLMGRSDADLAYLFRSTNV